jgi:hypothetical protein
LPRRRRARFNAAYAPTIKSRREVKKPANNANVGSLLKTTRRGTRGIPLPCIIYMPAKHQYNGFYRSPRFSR